MTNDLRELVRRNLHVNGCATECRCELLTHVAWPPVKAELDRLTEHAEEQAAAISRVRAQAARWLYVQDRKRVAQEILTALDKQEEAT